MSNSPSISVILVTYNAAQFLQRCLDSIYGQHYPHIEIIVMDGGSTDGTAAILHENTGNIAFWKSEKDSGIYEAMNKALDHARGEWIYFIGADDILTPAFSQMAEALTDPYAIYYGSVLKAGQKYLGQMPPYKQAKTGINHQAIIYPAGLFSLRRYDTRYRISADHVFNMQCHSDKHYHFTFKDFDIAIFNDTGISSLQKDAVFEKEKAGLILKHFGPAIYLRFLFKRLKERLFNH
ncbi:Glycosyltransferase involved in cell wall bisynthesis [Dyadobacter sp. SG02]|uniref:glycosyltransferase family 2 protein n=1 Tax=Dyadobacter sp. SG02 TaxID=1855291 RepID=UPI0008AD7B1A|nr:glycosyltransferase family 2 protein [Dyadobacter sp. SG02]SEI57307.1 Glycosyltransferase involved in cell wall bisynthesis [Dyadobacter sp. SG02]